MVDLYADTVADTGIDFDSISAEVKAGIEELRGLTAPITDAIRVLHYETPPVPPGAHRAPE